MLNIILVDDNPGDQKLFKEAIQEAHIDCRLNCAFSAQECFGMIRVQRPDLIFMDVIMPALSGGDFVRMLHKDPATRSIAVVFLTGIVDHNQNSDKDHQLNIAGVLFPALGKPIDPKRLAAVIAKTKIQ